MYFLYVYHTQTVALDTKKVNELIRKRNKFTRMGDRVKLDLPDIAKILAFWERLPEKGRRPQQEMAPASLMNNSACKKLTSQSFT